MENNKRHYMTEAEAENYIAKGEDEILKAIRREEASNKYSKYRQSKEFEDLARLAA